MASFTSSGPASCGTPSTSASWILVTYLRNGTIQNTRFTDCRARLSVLKLQFGVVGLAVDFEKRIRSDHRLRAIRGLVNEALVALGPSRPHRILPRQHARANTSASCVSASDFRSNPRRPDDAVLCRSHSLMPCCVARLRHAQMVCLRAVGAHGRVARLPFAP